MTNPLQLESLKAELGDGFVSLQGEGFDATIELRQQAMRPALEFLKFQGFNVLVDLTAVDYSKFGEGLEHKPSASPHRFKLTYRLMKLDAAQGLVEARVALECWVEDAKGPPSARDLWPCADWLEREVWDMFGIPFADRPGIKRLLLYEEFQGHPLCKDYPINKRQPLVGPKEETKRDRMLEGDLRPRIT